MKKIVTVILAAVMLILCTACATTTSTVTTPVATTANETEAEQDTVKDVLSFINKDEIYFDIHLTKGYFDKTSVKVGDQVLATSGKAAYTGSEEIVFEGTSDKEDTVYLLIISVKAGEKAMTDYSTVEASDLATMINKRIPIDKSGKDKVLVIVTDTKGEYDHKLDSSLDEIVKAVFN